MLLDNILSAQSGNENATLLLVNQFNPLLKKYARKLNYEDAYNDLLVEFLVLIKGIDVSNLSIKCDGSIVSYVSKSVYNCYIHKSKDNSEYLRKIFISSELSDQEKYYAEVSLSTFDNHDIILKSSLNSILSQHELFIVNKVYLLGYSSADIAKECGTSRQAVNQTKIRAIKKLKRILARVTSV